MSDIDNYVRRRLKNKDKDYPIRIKSLDDVAALNNNLLNFGKSNELGASSKVITLLNEFQRRQHIHILGGSESRGAIVCTVKNAIKNISAGN